MGNKYRNADFNIFFVKCRNFNQENYLCYVKKNRMKKFLCVIVTAGLFVSVADAQIKIGPEAGVILTNMTQKIDGNKYETDYKFGARIGAVVDIPLNRMFYIQPGLSLTANNGTESSFRKYYSSGAGLPTSVDDNREYSVTYLQMPVYFMFKTGKEFDDNHFFVGIGPYLNVAVGGRFKQVYTTTLNGLDRPNYFDRTIKLGDFRQEDDFRYADVGLNAMLGYEFKNGLFFRGYYGIGLLNMAPGGNKDNSFKNMGGGLTIGFLFSTEPRQTWGWR